MNEQEISDLRRALVAKVEKDWPSVWEKDYGEYQEICKLSSAHRFFVDLADDIFHGAEGKLKKPDLKKAERFSHATVYRFISGQTGKPSPLTLLLLKNYTDWKPVEPSEPIVLSKRKAVVFAALAFTLSFLSAGGIFYLSFDKDPPPRATTGSATLSMKSAENEDFYGKDRAAVLFAAHLTGLTELNAYRALPEIDSLFLDLAYTADSPSRKRVIAALIRRSASAWTMGNGGNKSNFQVLKHKILKLTADSAQVETTEHWQLYYWDTKRKKYCYEYDETDSQVHHLVKTPAGWRTAFVERVKDGKKYIDN